MNKRIWNLYAPLYERAMRGDRKVYQFMYDRIPRVIRGEEVLELATGPGLLTKHVVHAAKRMVATDYAEGMIREAQKGPCPANLTFEVADATALPYPDASFDMVLIANALHIMPVTPESMAVMIEDAISGNLNEAFFCRLRAAFIFYGIRSRSTARRMPTCTAG